MRLKDMFCPKCGKKIQDDAKFCKFCGNEIKKNKGHGRSRIVKKDNDKKDEKTSPVLIGAVVVAAIVLVVLVVLAMGVLNSDDSSNGSSNSNVFGISQSSSGQVAEDTVQSVSLSAFPVSEAPNLAQALSEQGYPSSINFKSVTLDTSQCLYILTKSIVEINSGNTGGTISVGNPAYAPSPSGADITQTISIHEYVDICGRFSSWIESNGQVPNYVGIYTGGVPDISPLNMLRIASDILIDYKNTGQLPETAVV